MLNSIKGEKLKLLRAQFGDPYPARLTGKSEPCQRVRTILEGMSAGQKKEENLLIAGRVVSLRVMGRSCFFHLEDASGRAQVYAKGDEWGPGFKLFLDSIEAGDFIQVQGFPFVTRTGEPSLHAQSWIPLTKALEPLPEKWHGLKDTETRFRRRHLDLIANPEVRQTFRKRSAIITAIRRTLEERCFMEVETPVFQPLAGGAAARPFTTVHQALDANLYLRIALELYLKRLIVGGLDRVYEIGKCFRNEGIDTTHNPEFTMLEAYQAYADYNDMMTLTEDIIRAAHAACAGENPAPVFEKRRLPVLWREVAGIGIEEVLTDPYHFNRAALERCAGSIGVAFDRKAPAHKIFDRIMDELILPKLPEFCFVLDYPTATSPLAKNVPGRPELVERFELFHRGAELANAFSELNDPVEQRRRMEEQARDREREKDDEIPELDEDFIGALAHGMPPTGGLGIGIDRLCMSLLGISSIREVILFPTLRREGSGGNEG